MSPRSNAFEQAQLMQGYVLPWRSGRGTNTWPDIPHTLPTDRWSSVRELLTTDPTCQAYADRIVLIAEVPSIYVYGDWVKTDATLLTLIDRTGLAHMLGFRAHLRLTRGNRLPAADESGAVMAVGCPSSAQLARLAWYGNSFVKPYTTEAPRGSEAATVIRALSLSAALDRQRLGGDMSPNRVLPTAVPLAVDYDGTPLGERPTARPPAPRLIRDAHEAELLAAEWLIAVGFPTARSTPVGTDSGLDILSSPEDGVVGQVKFEAVKTGRPQLQGLFGAGHGVGAKEWAFFSSAGYTAQALAWAEGVNMALFRFALDGSVEAVSSRARIWFGALER